MNVKVESPWIVSSWRCTYHYDLDTNQVLGNLGSMHTSSNTTDKMQLIEGVTTIVVKASGFVTVTNKVHVQIADENQPIPVVVKLMRGN